MEKIAFFITSTGWGGLEMNILKLAKLLSTNVEITLISTENASIIQKDINVFQDIFKLDKVKKYFDFKNAFLINKLLKQQEIKTILVFDNRDLDVIAIAKRLFFKDLKIIYQQHMQIGLNKKDPLHTWRYKAINFWVSPLNWLKVEVVKRTNYPSVRIKIIPLTLDTIAFSKPKYSKEQALKLLGINTKSTLIGIIGRISPKKGQLFVIQSLIELRKKGLAIELLVFGSPTINDPECVDYFNEIDRLVRTENLTKIVHFQKFTDDTKMFYNAIDIFTLASESETFGMVTIEAMLSKLPIIATNSGGSPEILGEGKYGTLYQFNDVRDYCEKVELMLSDMELTNRKAMAAQNYAISSFDSKYETEQFLNLLSL